MTVKTLIPVATSPPVVAVTFSSPAGAESLMVMLAVIEVGEFTTGVPLITTFGKVSAVTPCSQLVLMPLMVTDRVAPWPAELAVTLLITAGPGLM